MKKVIVLAALLVAASACATTTTNTNENANATANSNVSATPAPTPQGISQADIEAKERQTWDAMKAKNWDAFAGMLADDFVYVSGDGIANKAQTADGVKKLDISEYTFSDIKFRKVDEDLAIITYTSSEKSTYDGKPSPDKPLHNSSAWIKRGGNWLIASHQETEVMEMPAGQPTPAATATPAASPAATASASPAASPAAAPATATDAEKQVWEAMKRKDYDTFAGFLASDALDVEPDKVYTKSEAIEGIKHFDFSKFTQSDFKETKLDADATLVTYLVTGPMAGKTVKEYHSTIWTNRGGQWKAALHHGTPQKQ
jgi:hypothetical protein